MEVDQPTASGSNEPGECFLRRVEKAEETFLESIDRRLFLQKVSLPVLQRMCQNRGLDDTGYKNELYARLATGVSCVYLTCTRV
jgi:hypothetical protein